MNFARKGRPRNVQTAISAKPKPLIRRSLDCRHRKLSGREQLQIHCIDQAPSTSGVGTYSEAQIIAILRQAEVGPLQARPDLV